MLKTAMFWTLISVIVRYSLKLVGNLTLARLLTPEDFGLTAVVLAVVTGLEAITDVGTKPALIRTHRNDDAWLDTAWTFGVVRGVLIGGAIAIAAVPLAYFFKDMRLAGMIAATGSMSVLIGLTSITSVTVVRDLQLKQLALLEITAAVAGYVVMLTWAWLVPSAWALLSGAVVSTGAFTIASYFAFGRRPIRFRCDSRVLAELLGFGKWVFLASLLGFFIFQGDRISVAKLVSVSAVGLYAIAATWSVALQSVYGMFLSRLYLPVAAQLWRRHGAASAELLSLRRSVLATMFVPFILAAGCADTIINYLYPAIYAGAGPVMSVLVVGAWFGAFEFLYNDQLMISGEPRWRFLAQVASAVLMALCLLLMHGRYSAVNIAITFAAGALVRALILMYACDRLTPGRSLPDLALTGIFIALALAVRLAAHELGSFTPPIGVLIAAALLATPPGLIITHRGLRQILGLAEDDAAAPSSGTEHNDVGLETGQWTIDNAEEEAVADVDRAVPFGPQLLNSGSGKS